MINIKDDKIIAFFVGSLQQGGAERVIVNLANFWSENGKNIIIITLNDTPSFYQLNNKVKHIKLRRFKDSNGSYWKGFKENILRVYELRQALKKYKADVLISFITDANIIGILATLLSKINIIVSDRIDPKSEKYFVNPLKLIAKKNLYQFANSVVVQTEGAANYYKWLRNNKVKIINNPLAYNFTKPDINIEKEKIILAVGRLVNQKNFPLLIEAFSRLTINDWKLMIIGEGTERVNIEKIIATYKLNEKIVLVGNSANITDWYNKASIFVLSSNFEGYPNALIEAMSMGLAVISTDCDFGPNEIIENRKNGIIIKTNDVDEMAKSLELLIDDEELRTSLGNEAIKIRNKLSIDKIAFEWGKLL